MLKRLEELIAKYSKVVDKSPKLQDLMVEQNNLQVANSARAAQVFDRELEEGIKNKTLTEKMKHEMVKKYHDAVESSIGNMCDNVEKAIVEHLASLSKEGNTVDAQEALALLSSNNNNNNQPTAAASAAVFESAASAVVAAAAEEADDIYAQSTGELFVDAYKSLGPDPSVEEIDNVSVILKAYTIDPAYPH